MDTKVSSGSPEDRAKVLRAELKKWEKEFTAKNNGKKASRQDIRQNIKIAAKYKEYNRIRDAQTHHNSRILQEKHRLQSKTNERKQKLQTAEDHFQERFLTPRKRKISLEEREPDDSPSVARSLFTPRKISLGPTPQKEGRVLGLFDLLGDNESNDSLNVLEVIDPLNTQKTPPKSQIMKDQTSLNVNVTPASLSKRRKHDAFSTPAKNSRSDIYQGKTPLSVSKLNFSTPSFLRRDNSVPHRPFDLEENDEQPLSPQVLRVMKRKPPLKGLSSILADLREIQDENHDQELDVLREIEAEDMCITNRKSIASSKDSDLGSKKFDSLPDNQKISYLQFAESNDLASIENARSRKGDENDQWIAQDATDDHSTNVYKKKGQKRTTRLVKMKPSRSNPPPATFASTGNSVDDYIRRTHQGNSEILIPFQNKTASASYSDFDCQDQARNFNSDSQSEYTASEGETRYRRPKQRKKTSKVCAASTITISNKNESFVEGEKEDLGRVSTQKVSTLSLQNFRRLKLRNSGSKGPSAAVRSNRNKRFGMRKR
ncbi:DNA replication regulator SLD2 [Erysiphe neolycopersici]|uniref:DNA replication regulator SLD2 n=1 Tax=Erysiphe neolycopersici TaxID=212602 RepID=A0A420H849_9PEZI|nr:DNA replication regulator SLD2 [Erysiphe neolycopersici]